MKKSYKILLASAAVLVAVLFSCVYLDGINVDQKQPDGTFAPAIGGGEVATFVVNGHIERAGNPGDDEAAQGGYSLIFSVLAPKSWNLRDNAQISYRGTVVTTDEDEEHPMFPVPSTEAPKNKSGYTWADALFEKYGVGSNVLNDMEWVTFQSERPYLLENGDKPHFTITVKAKVGKRNERCRLGFFINYSGDGLSTDDRCYKVMYSNPFVVRGYGTLVDYVDPHFNAVTPLASAQNDYVTYSFNGKAYANQLVGQDVYLEAKAYTAEGKVYSVTEKSEKTLMKADAESNGTSRLTIWPAGFFKIPDGETISHIEYVYTNKDRSVVVDKAADDLASGNPVTPGEWFDFELSCGD